MIYNKMKNRLNSVFGMTFTDPVRASITINESGAWDITTPDIQDSLDKFYKSRNSFLVYAHGVWTTARAREHLQKLIDIVGADNAIYVDTDSCKGIMDDSVKKRIEVENDIIRKLCEERGAYVDYEGERYYLGVFDHETAGEPYKDFKTLGAKKYCYTDSSGFHITVSGVQKKIGAREMKNIDNFKPGFIFKEAGGKTLYYNDCEKHYITVDGVTMLTASNIGMIDSTYKLGVTGEYAELIGLNVYDILQ